MTRQSISLGKIMETASSDGMPDDVLIVEDDPIIALDFEDTIQKQGFTIDNPNAGGSCACGDSFS